MDRRHFLKHMAGMAAMAAPATTFVRNLRAAAPALKKDGKSLIILWMGGGPSHMDLWDLKPGAPTGGEFKPVKTKVSGVEIGELLPTVAGQMGHLSIIRSLQSNEGSHDRGTTLMNTGRMPSPIVAYPHAGALASSLLAAKDLSLPGFIGVGGTAQRVGAGFLGMTQAPFTVQNAGQPPANISAPAALGAGIEQQERVRRRQRLFYTIEDSFAAKVFPDAKVGSEERKAIGDAADAHAAVYKKGFDLTVSPLRTVFEVRNEPPKVLAEYGGMANGFGMGCLLARKLVEKGVTCVEVDLGGWDNHAGIFNTLRTGNGPRLDKGMGALVKELNERGLLKNTVVTAMGEFGRTPKINPAGGRDHHPGVWTILMGGGPIQGGRIVGESDELGNVPKTRPTTPGEVAATLYKALGLDPHHELPGPQGRPIPMTEYFVKPIQELF